MQVLSLVVLLILSLHQTQALGSRKYCNCSNSYVDKNHSKRFFLTKDKQELLNLHNHYRLQVAQGRVPGQPGSSKIKDLKWNKELETSAQKHADKCKFKHDTAKDRRTGKWWWVGQNIAYSFNIAHNVKMWFDEHKDYNYRSNNCSQICGHYTQLVWAKTTDVGCGVSRCNFHGFNALFVVCNYGPGGNFNNQRPY